MTMKEQWWYLYPPLLIIVLFTNIVNTQNKQDLNLGRSINIFSRIGYLSISIRVVPRNDSEIWLFREPSVDVYHGINKDNNVPTTSAAVTKGRSSVVFNGDFFMDFCDNVRQLFSAYFRDFTIEMLNEPWRAFTSSWSNTVAARELGINPEYLINNDKYSFILLKIIRHRKSGKIEANENREIPIAVLDEMNNVRIGDETSVMSFISSYGTHYVSSYVTGNALYQVFVYEKGTYERIKHDIKTNGIDQIPEKLLYEYLFYRTREVGRIQCASGNNTVNNWVMNNLRVNTRQSLMFLRNNAVKLSELNNLLQNEVVLKLDLRLITSIFNKIMSTEKLYWFKSTLDNRIKLWEANM